MAVERERERELPLRSRKESEGLRVKSFSSIILSTYCFIFMLSSVLEEVHSRCTR